MDNQTCSNGHLSIAATCLQGPLQSLPHQSFFTVILLYTAATSKQGPPYFTSKDGCCGQVWLYIENGIGLGSPCVFMMPSLLGIGTYKFRSCTDHAYMYSILNSADDSNLIRIILIGSPHNTLILGIHCRPTRAVEGISKLLHILDHPYYPAIKKK